MYPHPTDWLAMHEVTTQERARAARQEKLIRSARRAERSERWARRSARLTERLAERARRFRARAV